MYFFLLATPGRTRFTPWRDIGTARPTPKGRSRSRYARTSPGQNTGIIVPPCSSFVAAKANSIMLFMFLFRLLSVGAIAIGAGERGTVGTSIDAVRRKADGIAQRYRRADAEIKPTAVQVRRMVFSAEMSSIICSVVELQRHQGRRRRRGNGRRRR